MQFKVNAETMNSALKSTSRLFRDKTMNPILAYYKLTLDENDTLTIETATDEGVSVSQSVNAEVSFPDFGSFCAPQKIKDVFSLIKGNADIIIEEPFSYMTISCGAGNFSIPCSSADTYPEKAFPSDGEIFISTDISASSFCNGVMFALPFVDLKNTLRPVMASIHAEVTNGELSIAGTDAQKLAVYTDKAEGCPDFSANIAGVYADMFSLLADKTIANFMFNGKAIKVSSEGCSFTIPCVEGNYPNYKRIIPTKDSETASTIASKGEILRSAAIASICASKDTKIAKMTVSGEIMALYGEDLDAGGKSSGFASCSSADFAIGINLKNLSVAVNSFACENVRIGFSAPERPLVLTPDGDDKYTVIAMPVTF